MQVFVSKRFHTSSQLNSKFLFLTAETMRKKAE